MKKWIIILALLVSPQVFAGVSRVLDANQISITGTGNVLTLPAITDTVSTITSSDTLTNKTMSGASNTFSAIPVGAIGNGSVLSGSNSGDVTIGSFGSTPNANGLSLSGQAINLQPADSTHSGGLSYTDWGTFNGKLGPSLTSGDIFVGSALNVATGVSMSGNVTISNTGATTIGANQVTAGMLTSGAAAAGTVATADGSGNVTYVASSVSPSLNGGSVAPQAVTASGGVTLTGLSYNNFVWVIGSPGAVTVTATPSITACTNDGQKLTIMGTDATKKVTLQDNAGLSGSNLQLNGTWVGGLYSVLELTCDITAGVWVEVARR